MKRLKRFFRKSAAIIRNYWLPLALGFITSGASILFKSAQGHFAFGAEWLFPVWFSIIHFFIRAYFRKKARRSSH